jgi:RNA polymerase sigma factor (sigma-70 family)
MSDMAEVESDAALYAAVATELVVFAAALVGRNDAQDVMSTAVMRALASPKWRAVGNRRAYLYRSVFNEAKTWNRRAAQRRVREARATWQPTWDLPEFHPEVVAAVRALSVQQRAVIVLTYWADLTPAQVAERMGVSEGSVRRHLARARARLREVLDV